MNKQELISTIIEKLRADLALFHKAAGAARAEATDEQSMAENKYDTRGLEASYLARGQSRVAADIEQAIAAFEQLAAREFASAEAIDLGALVALKSGKEKSLYFIGPRAGGTEIVHEQEELLVITPESPLGSQLMGRKAGEKCVIELAGEKQEFNVAQVA